MSAAGSYRSNKALPLHEYEIEFYRFLTNGSLHKNDVLPKVQMALRSTNST